MIFALILNEFWMNFESTPRRPPADSQEPGTRQMGFQRPGDISRTPKETPGSVQECRVSAKHASGLLFHHSSTIHPKFIQNLILCLMPSWMDFWWIFDAFLMDSSLIWTGFECYFKVTVRFALKIPDFASKIPDSASTISDFASKISDFVLIITIPVSGVPWRPKADHFY